MYSTTRRRARRIGLNTNNDLRVGLVSDTHGLFRPEARAFLIGCDYIIHGGDIGKSEILEELAAMAPLIAVRGNNDTQPWAARLRETELIRVGNVFVYVIHNLAELDMDPGAAGVAPSSPVIRINRRSSSATESCTSTREAAGRDDSSCRSAPARSGYRAAPSVRGSLI